MSEYTASDLRGADVGSSPAVAAIRAKMLDGLAPVDAFAAAIGKTPRTIYSYIALGLPVTYIGRTPYVIIEPARDWLRAQGAREIEPRRRGRPRKVA